MLRTAVLTTATAFALSTVAMLFAPAASAGVGDILDTLEEFDDIAECDYVTKKVRVKVRTRSGYKWVWVRKRVRVCDDDD